MQPTNEELRAYEAQTARVNVLAGFVGRFAPGIGQGTEVIPGYIELPAGVEHARNTAVRNAMEAITRIAKNS